MNRLITGLLLTNLLFPTVAKSGVTPTIKVHTTTTKYVDCTNKAASGVYNDQTDPLLVYGIDFIITDDDPASTTITCTSSSTSVVANDATHLIVSGTGNIRNVKIKPSGIGYSSITVKVKDIENKTVSYVLKYAASAAASNPAKNNFHTFYSSASTAIPIGTDYMFIGDDEVSDIYLFDRKNSGAPLTKSPIVSQLNLPDGGDTEVDIEASCVSPTNANKIYWMGSMSNSNSGNLKPNRDRIFATNITGSGSTSTLSFAGYAALRSKILQWGDTYGYNLTASGADGMDPKGINGLSVEGMEFAPNNTTLYIGFRTPLVPANSRTKALICPLLNFETWFNNGSPAGNPTFGTPIELNLGGRGIRSIGRNAYKQYVIVAGAYDGTENFALYQWTGNSSDTPVLLTSSLAGLSPEGIVEVPSTLANGATIELVNDYGSADWYNDGKESKDLSNFEFQKFSSTEITLSGVITSLVTHKMENTSFVAFPNPVSQLLQIRFESVVTETGQIEITNYLGQTVYSGEQQLREGENEIRIDCSSLIPGTYLVNIKATSFASAKFLKN